MLWHVKLLRQKLTEFAPTSWFFSVLFFGLLAKSEYRLCFVVQIGQLSVHSGGEAHCVQHVQWGGSLHI